MRESRAPCPIKTLTCPPRAPWEEALTGCPKPEKYGNAESYGKVQGSAGKSRHGICGMPEGFARRHDGGPPVEGDLRRWNVLVGCVVEMVSGMKPPASTPYLVQRRDAALSPTIMFSTRHWLDPFARAKFSLLLKRRGPFERELTDKTAD